MIHDTGNPDTTSSTITAGNAPSWERCVGVQRLDDRQESQQLGYGTATSASARLSNLLLLAAQLARVRMGRGAGSPDDDGKYDRRPKSWLQWCALATAHRLRTMMVATWCRETFAWGTSVWLRGAARVRCRSPPHTPLRA